MGIVKGIPLDLCFHIVLWRASVYRLRFHMQSSVSKKANDFFLLSSTYLKEVKKKLANYLNFTQRILKYQVRSCKAHIPTGRKLLAGADLFSIRNNTVWVRE